MKPKHQRLVLVVLALVALNGVLVGTVSCEFRLNCAEILVVAVGAMLVVGACSGTVCAVLITPPLLAA